MSVASSPLRLGFTLSLRDHLKSNAIILLPSNLSLAHNVCRTQLPLPFGQQNLLVSVSACLHYLISPGTLCKQCSYMTLSCRLCLARKQGCCGNETINKKCSEQCLACNNCSRNVSIFISIYFWLSWQNCCVLHIIYPLVFSLHWWLLCNRLRNKGEVLALLINKFRGRASTGRVQAELLPCFSDFSAWPSSVLAYVETGLRQGSQMASSIARTM